jgi:hypothetical protein
MPEEYAVKLDHTEKHAVLFRTLLALLMVAVAAAVRIAPHPWNFTPIGAMALFSGAVLRNRRLAFLFPLLALFAGDVFVGFHKLMPFVYASFAVNIAIGLWLRDRRNVTRVGLAVFAGATQFFLVTNFAIWAYFNTFPKTPAGLGACYLAGLPLFWNTLGSDAIYSTLFFGGYALAERLLPTPRSQNIRVLR